MKTFLAFGILFFALSFCGISERIQKTFDGSSKSNETETNSENGETAKTGSDDEFEKPDPTAAQKAIIEGGEKIIWEEQGLGFIVPKGWNKMEVNKTTFNYGSPATGFLIVSISSLGESFPIDTSLKAYYDQAIQRMKSGELDRVRYLEIDDTKGLETIEAMPEDKSSPRRHQWIGYRLYNNQVQMINVIISTDGSKFDDRADTFGAILYSMKFNN